jgi:serine O-acetyltransferase
MRSAIRRAKGGAMTPVCQLARGMRESPTRNAPVIYVFRLSSLLCRLHIPVLPWILKTLNRILFSVVLPPSVVVGKNVLFGYQGLGIVIHKEVVIGSNVTICQNVTVGGRGGPGVPIIEDDVFIGAGACVLGPVRIGNGARIGANAVVLTDIPPGAVAIGIPASVVGSGTAV